MSEIIAEVIPKLNEVIKTDSSDWKFTKYCNITPLTQPGENYGSIIVSLDVIYEINGNEKVLNVVVKMCPNNEVLKQAFLTNITFKNELSAYLELFPAIQNFEKELNVSPEDCLDIFAKSYGGRLNLLADNNLVDKNAVIILENLKILGYIVEDRLQGLNLQASEMVVIELAKLHATMISIKKLQPKTFEEKVMPSLRTINEGGIMVKGFVRSALKVLKNMEDLNNYYEIIKSMVDKRIPLKGLLFPVQTDLRFYSIIHSDLWTNNIMFLKNEDNKYLKVKIIDLQLIKYGSIARDILHFLFTSVQIKILNEKFDYFLELYYKSFTKYLLSFKCYNNIEHKWSSFKNEINNVAPHELFHILFMIKPIFSERGSIQCSDNIKESDFGKMDNLGDVYKLKLKQIVLTFAERNWLLQ